MNFKEKRRKSPYESATGLGDMFGIQMGDDENSFKDYKQALKATVEYYQQRQAQPTVSAGDPLKLGITELTLDQINYEVIGYDANLQQLLEKKGLPLLKVGIGTKESGINLAKKFKAVGRYKPKEIVDYFGNIWKRTDI